MAVIVLRAVNVLLFESFDKEISGQQDFVISQDLYKDARLRESVKILFSASRAVFTYICIDFTLSPIGGPGSLVLLGEGNISINSSQLECLSSVRDMIQDRYAIQAHSVLDIEFNHQANISILLNSLQTYLSAANHISKQIDVSLQSEFDRASGNFSEEFYIMLPILCKQLQTVVESMAECTGRVSCVARYFTEPNRRRYYISCFYFSLQGFVPSLNESLLELSRIVPSYQLKWYVNLDTELVDSPHRSFTPHLQFFLENLILLWSSYSSGAEVSVSYQRSGRCNETDNMGYISVTFQPRIPEIAPWRSITTLEDEASGSSSQSVALHSSWLVKMMNEFLSGMDRQAKVDCQYSSSSSHPPSYSICLPCHFMPGRTWSKSSSDSQRSSAVSVYRILITPRGGLVGRNGKRESVLRNSVLTTKIKERGFDGIWLDELEAAASPRSPTKARLRFSVQMGDGMRGRRRSVCCEQMYLIPLASPTNQGLVEPTNQGMVADPSKKEMKIAEIIEDDVAALSPLSQMDHPSSPPSLPSSMSAINRTSRTTYSLLGSTLPSLLEAWQSVFRTKVSPQPSDNAEEGINKAASNALRSSLCSRNFLSLRFSDTLQKST
ncbi:hypothetical protein EON65_16585 [archaeon]|nr:MAG: hypothetical protein EON65_16585 [archaeon]